MRKLSFAIVFVTPLLLAAPAARAQSQPPATMSVDAAIKAIADQYVKASMAGDAKAIAALYTEDAVEMPPNQPMVKGRAAIQQHYETLFKGAKMGTFTLNHIEARSAGDLGYDVGTYSQSVTPEGGTAMTDSGKFTVILKRTGGAWKVAYAIYNSDQPPPMKH